MGRKVDVDDLLTTAEVAELLGLSHYNSVTTYMRRYDHFPRPVVERTSGRVRLWLRPEVEEWMQDRRGEG
ncbi:MAG: hypothetical protein P8N02_06315 [Actinomycetota bacterium]|nr:hypothetical protein [Actinomycetota bacterium]